MHHHRATLALAAIATVVAAGSASAQVPREGLTQAANYEPLFLAGRPSGCALAFEVYQRDDRSSGGQFVRISGSLNFYVHPDAEPFIVLKLGVTGREDTAGEPRIFWRAPAEIGLTDGEQTNGRDFIEKIPSEIEGFTLSGYRFDSDTMRLLVAGLSEDRLRLYWVMSPNGLSNTTEVDLNVVDDPLDGSEPQRTTGTGQRFSDCISRVLTAQAEALEETLPSKR